MSWTVMRTWFPTRRTLPSITVPTSSSSAISRTDFRVDA